MTKNPVLAFPKCRFFITESDIAAYFRKKGLFLRLESQDKVMGKHRADWAFAGQPLPSVERLSFS
jgi:hypothetical protein